MSITFDGGDSSDNPSGSR